MTSKLDAVCITSQGKSHTFYVLMAKMEKRRKNRFHNKKAFQSKANRPMHGEQVNIVNKFKLVWRTGARGCPCGQWGPGPVCVGEGREFQVNFHMLSHGDPLWTDRQTDSQT